jgi:hypothetical protein
MPSRSGTIEVDRANVIPDPMIWNQGHCSVCGNVCEAGERVLALAYLSFPTRAVPNWPAVSGCNPGTRTIVGHRECVLGELLTSFADFQPAPRLVSTAADSHGAKPAFRESHGDLPGFFHRTLMAFGGALRRGIQGKSSHDYMKQFGGNAEYWERAIAGQLGWPRQQPAQHGSVPMNSLPNGE